MRVIHLLKFISILFCSCNFIAFSETARSLDNSQRESYIPNLITHICRPEKGLYKFDVTFDEIRSTPQWLASNFGKLSIKAKQGFDITKTRIARYADDTILHELYSITLERFGDSNYWFYVYSFKNVKTEVKFSNVSLIDPSIDIILLLSGKVIEGEKINSYSDMEYKSHKNQRLNADNIRTDKAIDYISSDGKFEYKFHVEDKIINPTPSWDPLVDETMPLPPVEAIKIAKKEISEYLPDYWEYDVYNLAIKRYHTSKKWIYIVGFRKSSLSEFILNLAILSSGRPVKGEIVKTGSDFDY